MSVLVTSCQETRADIEMTVSSFLAQTYPSDRFEVLMAIEPDDEPVMCYAAESLNRLREAGIAGRIVVSDGKIRIKPHALNQAIRQAQGKYLAFYDAADVIDPDQVEKAVRLMEERDYDVMQSAVFRKRPLNSEPVSAHRHDLLVQEIPAAPAEMRPRIPVEW